MELAEVARLGTTVDGRTIVEVAGQPAFGIVKEFGIREERVASDVAKFIEALKDRLLAYDDK